jgi:hypothetical protein
MLLLDRKAVVPDRARPLPRSYLRIEDLSTVVLGVASLG